jgi:hypothetical protein
MERWKPKSGKPWGVERNTKSGNQEAPEMSMTTRPRDRTELQRLLASYHGPITRAHTASQSPHGPSGIGTSP